MEACLCLVSRAGEASEASLAGVGRRVSQAGVKKGDICSSPPPTRYSLTPEGLELAQKLAESEGLSSLTVGIGPEQTPGEEPEVPGAASAEL